MAPLRQGDDVLLQRMQRPNMQFYSTANHVKLYNAPADFSDVVDDLQVARNGGLRFLSVQAARSRHEDVEASEGANHVVRDLINVLPTPRVNGSARFLYDDHLPQPTSRHQKLVIVRNDCDLNAYVGGADLTNDHCDTLEHEQVELGERAGISVWNGWLDIHAHILGHS
ncbi:PhosphoLipase D-like protein [Phytophthora palmivora]|uniref:PhosphoLipase D-like protein n=1 Tax=Phytophthora palmivora TaxID=4796 RepID=A0A2P4YV00_9STRA|nr:PhosphoLipase D-like protein [Phytophthora palmivora]